MEQELLKQLETKFPGVEASILGRIAKNLAKTTTTNDQIATVIERITLRQVIENYGDSRATEASQTAVKNYEKKYGLKEGQKAQGGETTNKPSGNPNPSNRGDLTSQITAAATAVVHPLQENGSSHTGKKTGSARKQQMATILEKLHNRLRNLQSTDHPTL